MHTPGETDSSARRRVRPQVTRDVPPDALLDLYCAPPRACLAVVRDGGTRLMPVLAHGDPTGLTVVVAAEDADGLDGARAQVVLDDGVGWFSLRTVAVRGSLQRLAPGHAALSPSVAFRLTADRTVCWDYGALRPVDAPTPKVGAVADAARAGVAGPSATGPAGGARDDALRFVRASRVLIVGTTSAGGMPFATPIWFVPDRGGVLRVTSGGASWAGRNVTTHPEVTLLLGGERCRTDRRRLLVEGTAVVRAGLPPLRTAPTIASRYYLAPHEAATELRHRRQWGLRLAYYAQHGAEPGHLEVTVRRARFVPVPTESAA